MTDAPLTTTVVHGERGASVVIHLLHIRKTGGTALWHAIKAYARTAV